MNLRPLPPQGSALPTAPHPDIAIFRRFCRIPNLLYHLAAQKSSAFLIFLAVFLKKSKCGDLGVRKSGEKWAWERDKAAERIAPSIYRPKVAAVRKAISREGEEVRRRLDLWRANGFGFTEAAHGNAVFLLEAGGCEADGVESAVKNDLRDRLVGA